VNQRNGNTNPGIFSPLKRLLLLSALLLPLLQGCYSTKEVGIQVLHPPEKMFFNTPRNIVLLNRMLPEERWMDTLRFHDLKIPVKMYHELAWNTIYGFADIASDSPWTDEILFDSVFVDSVGVSVPSPLPREQRDRIMQKNGAITCVDLSDMWLTDSIYKEEEFMIAGDDDAGSWFTIVNVLLTIRSSWYLYELSDTLPTDAAVLYDTLHLSSAGYSYRDAIGRLPNIKKAIYDLATTAGQHNAYRIFPVWDPVTRIYYTGSNKKMKEAAGYAEQNKWMAAALIWRRLAYTAGKKLAAKAAFNMALVSEINDKLDVAVSWLQRSLDLEESRITRNYLDILQERLEEYHKMNLKTSGS